MSFTNAQRSTLNAKYSYSGGRFLRGIAFAAVVKKDIAGGSIMRLRCDKSQRPAACPALVELCGGGASDLTTDFLASLAFDDCNVVLTLQIEPESRRVDEVPAQSDRRVRGNGAPPIQNVRDTTGRNANVECQTVRTQVTRLKLPLQ